MDDDEISRETFLYLSKTIRELDIAAAFDNPEQAIRYVGNHVVDLAVLAIKMPVHKKLTQLHSYAVSGQSTIAFHCFRNYEFIVQWLTTKPC